METIGRIYDSIIDAHLNVERFRQMLFLAGARQTGKTTCGKHAADVVLNWDNLDDRATILAGPRRVMELIPPPRPDGTAPVLLLDEIHKYKEWKDFLKGFFDTYSDRVRVLATGSARMDVFGRGGDSLMGRYFSCHVHQLSVGELLRTSMPDSPVSKPAPIPDSDWDRLRKFGGYPEPYSRASLPFLRRWRRMRRLQLMQEDLRDLSRVHDIAQMDVLATLLERRAGSETVYASLAQEVRVSENTVREWISILNSLYFGFSLTPWAHNPETSLRKTPKWYPHDWSGIDDAGQRNETMLANHLLKAVDLWNDFGFGEFSLHYYRDKQKREVDFVVVRDGAPWILAECKSGCDRLSRSLAYLQEATKAPIALQIVMDAEYRDADCFAASGPTVVPGRTFLSQLP